MADYVLGDFGPAGSGPGVRHLYPRRLSAPAERRYRILDYLAVIAPALTVFAFGAPALFGTASLEIIAVIGLTLWAAVGFIARRIDRDGAS